MLWLLNDISRYVKLLAVFICYGYLPKLYPWLSLSRCRMLNSDRVLSLHTTGLLLFSPRHLCTCQLKMAEQSRSALISSEPTESKSNSHDHEHHHHHRTLHQTLLGKGSEAPGRRVLVGVDGSEFSNFALGCKCCAGIPAFPSDLCHNGSLSSQSPNPVPSDLCHSRSLSSQSPKPVPSGLCHSGSFSSQSPKPSPADLCYSGSLFS